VGGQVAGKALAVFLGSNSGERLLEAVDKRPLTPLEHRVLAQKWSGNIGKALSAATATLFVVQGDSAARSGGGPMSKQAIDWVQVMQRTAEIMLAVGAIFKVVGEFLEDRQKTADESQHAAAKRLV
jgi:hypothetical protein